MHYSSLLLELSILLYPTFAMFILHLSTTGNEKYQMVAEYPWGFYND